MPLKIKLFKKNKNKRKKECKLDGGPCLSSSKRRAHYKPKSSTPTGNSGKSYKPPYKKPGDPVVKTINLRTTVGASDIIKDNQLKRKKHLQNRR